jgi:hypothetical protein
MISAITTMRRPKLSKLEIHYRHLLMSLAVIYFILFFILFIYLFIYLLFILFIYLFSSSSFFSMIFLCLDFLNVEVSRSHSFRHTRLGKTTLDEWSGRRRDHYLTKHNTHKRQTCIPPAGFQPTIPITERTQTLSVDGAASKFDCLT